LLPKKFSVLQPDLRHLLKRLQGFLVKLAHKMVVLFAFLKDMLFYVISRFLKKRVPKFVASRQIF